MSLAYVEKLSQVINIVSDAWGVSDRAAERPLDGPDGPGGTHSWTMCLHAFLRREEETLQDELNELSASLAVCTRGKGDPDGTACSSVISNLTCAKVRPFSQPFLLVYPH